MAKWNLEEPSRQKSLFEISEDEDIDLDDYITKQVEVWERTDTMNWLIWAGCKLGQAYGLMSTKFAVPGIKLLRLTKQDFRKYDPHFGAMIYDLLHEKCDQERSLPQYAALEIASDNETSDYYSGNGSSGVDSDSAEEPQLERPQLPKFIISLLLDPNYCPEWIRWENYENKSFRFVRNNDVAKLWGMMDSKKNMTYEKLTRAIRYYYDEEVEESGVFAPDSERLVYRFGKKARGFETDNLNFGFQF